jgi:hypothetical protein
MRHNIYTVRSLPDSFGLVRIFLKICSTLSVYVTQTQVEYYVYYRDVVLNIV